ncbi:DUF1684 domain-containing protein [Hymenobacter taeanensis]|uniref:DUF1684 domain-containing protein n=1 Tax=Hymenobacter taeanensis TaxID=2735321 RepID=A0A6M6BHV6_9BACT|nr:MULTISPECIES: DUF1684 domain-containing protein [Hymenobacter]QJX47384.1 DUF1684 domain-containing protein [Hymenobacter taeanensis]UOQ79276.1 DUF1684 domain-containing protein [Hymenobacter sp. 5414T-23]
MRINPKLLIGIGLLIVFGYFFKDLVFNDDQYAARLRKARKEKDDGYRRVQGSPLSSEQRQAFDSLRYFAPNKNYRFEAQLEAFSQRDTVPMALTDGKEEKYLRWGRASFILDKQEYKLTMFLKADGKDSTLFIPFTDRTNGFTTYGGGRYLDAALPENGATDIVLDFNEAYNPYCAYNNSYACPVPPTDNRLPIEIKAGEQEFHDHSTHAEGEEHK